MDFNELAERTRQGLGRNQVVIGKDLFTRYARSNRLGMVWVTEDLAPHAIAKMREACAKMDIHLIIGGDSAEMGAITGRETTKVYLFKKSFSGLSHILTQFEDQRRK